MKKAILFLMGLFIVQMTIAQSTARINIKATVQDTSSNALGFATVMLLQPKDSALVSYGRTDENGLFELKGVKRQNYLLKITYVGMLPYQQDIVPADGPTTDLGLIKIKPIQKELFEVVVKTAKAPLNIKGDTVEYNASSFKVPPGSTVEDLLRKLPGLSVDGDGNIKAQGQDVNRVTVDGKQFFGADPKLATKNLPAEAISKVQVFNDKTEQAKLTGIDDGKKEKTLNLELKDSHKKGGFGKITAGLGNDQRAELKGNYNKFDKKNQFSVIGLGNNTNQTGLGWDDYQDFRGNQSFNWNDEAEFGFSSGNRVIYFGEDESDNLTVPRSYGRGQGFSNNFAGGANYNYDTKKTKFSTNYYYNQTRQITDLERNRTSFAPNNSNKSTEESTTINFNRNHRVTLRYEQTIDSLNTIVGLHNSKFSDGNGVYRNLQDFFELNGTPRSNTNINNSRLFNSIAMANTLIYRHKAKKKGRSLAVSGGFNLNDSDSEGILFSVNKIFKTTDFNEKMETLNRLDQTLSNRKQYKASALYVEPIGKRLFLESFYNFSFRNELVNRDLTNRETNQLENGLSAYYDNDISYNRLGTSLRYNYKGFNLSVGAAGQQIAMNFLSTNNENTDKLVSSSRKFVNFVPNVSLNADLKNNRYLWAGYNVGVQEPNIRDLQPVVDVSNPFVIRQGNPNLKPSTNHNVSVGYNYFNPASFTNLFFNASYSYNVNQIVYTQTIDNQFRTISSPINIDGGKNYNAWMGFGFPLKKTKATMNLNTGYNGGNYLTFINNVLNQTNTNSINFNLRLDLTPSDIFTMYSNANWSISDTKYSINSAQNQRILNSQYNTEMNIKLPKEFYFNTRLNYNIFVNRSIAFERNQPILNASVYHIIGKNKKAEIRLSAYDIFNQNLGIRQNASVNFVSEERVQTLARYFMLSYTYNMRGVTNSMRRRSGF
ncbi:MAG: TonB-dependent receptor domain-containing protein [Spirosomataceae bacterium]